MLKPKYAKINKKFEFIHVLFVREQLSSVKIMLNVTIVFILPILFEKLNGHCDQNNLLHITDIKFKCSSRKIQHSIVAY